MKVYGVVKTVPKFRMIKEKGELINRKISWIMVSFDNDKISIILVNK